MRAINLIFFIFFIFSGIKAQNIDELYYGTDNSLEIISWNIEFFPHNDEVTVSKLKELIPALNADIFAFQEVAEVAVFKQMVNEIEGYNAYVSTTDDLIKLAYVYKTSSVQVKNVYEIFSEAEYDLPFYRRPYLMEFTYNNEQYVSINNHLKAGGDGMLNKEDAYDEENRRWVAINLLKDYIDTNLPSSKVVILGDLNDILTDEYEHNVFQAIMNDSQNYTFADIDIANSQEKNWSYPSWPSHIDHIIITNELFNTFYTHVSNVTTLKIEDYFAGGWQEYRSNISDHRPIGIRLFQGDSLIFYKDFEDQSINSGGWTSFNTSGAQDWHVPNTQFGHNNTYCGFVSGYDNGYNVNEDWLVSPPFNADTFENLRFSFWNTSGYGGPPLQLYFSNDFTDNPKTATWIPIQNLTWHDGDPFWDWTYSGLLNLGEFTGGAARIAFKYTSDASEAATWELDDIRLSNDVNIFEISVLENTSEGGNTLGGGTFTYGEPVALEASPNDGYNFINWTEDGTVVSSNPQYKFTANSNRSIIANFEAIVQITDQSEDPLKIYPNPVRTQLIIEGDNIEYVMIHDVSGRKVVKKLLNGSNVRLNFKDVSEGIYILKVKMGERIFTKKITKI